MSQVFGILVLMYVGHVGKDLRPVLTTLIPCLHPSTNIRLHHRKPSAQSVEDGNHSSDSQESREVHAEMHTTMSTSRLMRRAPIHEHWSPTMHSYGAPARRCYLESSPVPERQNYKYHGASSPKSKSLNHQGLGQASAKHLCNRLPNMRGLSSRLSSLTACCAVMLLSAPSFVLAKPLDPAPHQRSVPNLLPKQVITPGGAPCGQNNATNRACWKNNWNISTDYEVTNPPAFNTVNVDLHITNVTNWVGPDGVVKPAMLINNQFPGPTITADWGDYIQVNVYNDLQHNGTSIHWHGIRQFGESNQDGANGVTECPIPPGSMKSYTFHVTQYGTSWYHSHYSNQYGNGVVGALIVNGPASANYDIDLGPYMIQDYYRQTADRLHYVAELVQNGPPPDSSTITFRGKSINPTGSGGSYDRLVLTPGKKHLLRLINASVDNSFTVSLVGHTFTVIATDLVPVTPVVRSKLFMGVGQRYDVIVEANQAVGNYWLNATLEANGNCGTSLNKFPAAIIQYSGASSTALPTNKGTPVTATCAGESGFAPIVKRTISSSLFAPSNLPITLNTPTKPQGQVFEWRIRNTPIVVEWDHPVLEYILEGNNSFPAAINLVEVPAADAWTFWVIQNDFALPHPIHLHGHDFLTLGIGTGTFSASTMLSQLNFNNPVRRDVVQVPGGGWLVMAYKTDNPGVWLMHCHIGWHVAMGLGIQFLERKNEIKQLMKLDQMEPNCKAWRTYQPKSPYLPKVDSGLKRDLGGGGMREGVRLVRDGFNFREADLEAREPAVRRLW